MITLSKQKKKYINTTQYTNFYILTKYVFIYTYIHTHTFFPVKKRQGSGFFQKKKNRKNDEKPLFYILCLDYDLLKNNI
jgi:hypothetical protein